MITTEKTLIDALSAKRDELVAAHQATLDSYPEELSSSLENAKSLMDHRSALKERLRMRLNSGVTESEETRGWAFEILTIGDQLNDIYGQKDFFEGHGYLPEVANIDAEQTPAQLMQRMLTLRTYVSRESRKLRKLPIMEEQHQTTMQKLQAFESELHQVTGLLAAMTKSNGSI